MPESLALGGYEFRVQGDDLIWFDWRDAFARRRELDGVDVPARDERTIYTRPIGTTPWGWHSGPHAMDAAAEASWAGIRS
ncbi:MAG: hypothetical protein BGN97_04440 [Microbacterium sp. 69-10]|uniref:hypothetical protein n=1 Tax=Microbacterium sp. 69-10 TaxID=1895783 RepID=UPI00095F5501|nr:hypothetical protein [Microbacterium sp. 69-10]OJU42011.1 MAG: hypothetical protein BGN97_04440 [Microbacterium sp. 69-10]